MLAEIADIVASQVRRMRMPTIVLLTMITMKMFMNHCQHSKFGHCIAPLISWLSQVVDSFEGSLCILRDTVHLRGV